MLNTAATPLAVSGGDLASVAEGDKSIVYLILLTSLVALGFAAVFAKGCWPRDRAPRR